MPVLDTSERRKTYETVFGGLPANSVEMEEPDYRYCVSINDQWAIPEIIGVTIQFEEKPELPHSVRLVVNNESGTPECHHLEITGGIDREVTGTMIRNIPVKAMVREATVHSRFCFTFSEEEAGIVTPRGRAVVDGKQAWILPDDNEWEGIVQHRALIESGSHRSGKGIPLQEIAKMHEKLKKEGHPAPVKEIMNRYGISRPTAQRWMRKAREMGLVEHSTKSRPKK